jgi:hypothetical protein
VAGLPVRRALLAGGTLILYGEMNMKKLSLNMDELRVESFSTDLAQAERGTVEANSLPTYPLCSGYSGCRTYRCETATCTLDVCC